MHHPSSCTSSHRTAAPAATLMVPSIKKPSKCAISSFSFSYLFLLYTLPGEGSQEPGQHFSHFSNLLYRRLTGSRPGDTILKPPTINKGFLPFLGVSEFEALWLGAGRPATLIHRLSTTRVIDNLWEFRSFSSLVLVALQINYPRNLAVLLRVLPQHV